MERYRYWRKTSVRKWVMAGMLLFAVSAFSGNRIVDAMEYENDAETDDENSGETEVGTFSAENASEAGTEPSVLSAGDTVDSGTAGSNVTWTLTEKADGTYELTLTGSGAISDCRYGQPWEDYADGITSVEVGEGITQIGSYAFEDCAVLREVTLPESLKIIENNAFSNCTGLENLTIPEGMTRIGSMAFSGCTALKEIVIPGSTGTVENYAFQNCSGLEKVTIEEGSVSLGQYVFQRAGNNAELTVGAGTEIGRTVFQNFDGLQTAVLEEGITSIEGYAFSGCDSLEKVVIGTAVNQNIGSYAFSGCSQLTTVEVFGTEGTLGENAFQGCTSITSVTIRSGVAAIGADAFSGCYGIQSNDFVIETPCALTAETLEDSNIWMAHDDWVKIRDPELYEVLQKLAADSGNSGEDFDGSHEIEGYEDVTEGTNDAGTWIYQAARWTNEEKTEAELRVDFSYKGKASGKDYIFVVNTNYYMKDYAVDMISFAYGLSRRIFDGQFGDSRIGIIPFNSSARTSYPLEETSGEAEFADYWESLEGGFNTSGKYYYSGFQAAYNMIAGRTDTSRETVVLFLGDGEPTDSGYMDTVELIREGDGAVPATPIYAVGIGADASGEEVLSGISDGNVFLSQESGALASLFQRLIDETKGQTIQACLMDPINNTYFTIPENAEMAVQTLDPDGDEGNTGNSDTGNRESVKIVTDPDTGEQVLEWDLSGLEPNTSYSLIVSGITLKKDENENFLTGELPIAAGDAAVSDNSGGNGQCRCQPGPVPCGSSDAGLAGYYSEPD